MFSKFAYPYFYIFYFCGQSPFNPIKNSSQIIHTTAITLSGVIMATSVLAIVSQLYLAPYFGVTDAFLASLFISSVLVTTLSVYFQNQFFGKNLQSLWTKLEAIEKHLCRPFEEPLDSSVFSKMYLPKFLLNVGLLIAHISIKFGFQSKYTHITVQSFILFLQYFSLLANLHMLFYITVFGYFLHSMIQRVNQMFGGGIADSLQPKLNALIEFLAHCKLVHLKLWEAVQIVNDHFGWSLAAICIQNFFDVTYALYWIFLYMQADDDSYLTIRKYVLTFNWCLFLCLLLLTA